MNVSEPLLGIEHYFPIYRRQWVDFFLFFVQAELDKLDYEEGKEEDLLNRQHVLSREVRELQDKAEILQSRWGFDFSII